MIVKEVLPGSTGGTSFDQVNSDRNNNYNDNYNKR